MIGSAVHTCSDDRISSAHMFRKARSRLQTPDVRSRTHNTGCTNITYCRKYLVAGLTGCRDLYTAVEDNINMHLKETVDEGIDWIHVVGGKGK